MRIISLIGLVVCLGISVSDGSCSVTSNQAGSADTVDTDLLSLEEAVRFVIAHDMVTLSRKDVPSRVVLISFSHRIEGSFYAVAVDEESLDSYLCGREPFSKLKVGAIGGVRTLIAGEVPAGVSVGVTSDRYVPQCESRSNPYDSLGVPPPPPNPQGYEPSVFTFIDTGDGYLLAAKSIDTIF